MFAKLLPIKNMINNIKGKELTQMSKKNTPIPTGKPTKASFTRYSTTLIIKKFKFK